MTDLPKGGNAALSSTSVELAVSGAARGTVDLMVFQLDAQRRVRTDADFVFFNQPVSPEGAVRLIGPDQVAVELADVPTAVQTLAVAVCLDDSVPGVLDSVPGLAVEARAGADTVRVPAPGLAVERAAVLVELYRREGQWKVRNVSAGWDGGLAAMAVEFGVDVGEPAPEPASESTPEPEPAPVPTADGRVDLGKRTGQISLSKGQRVAIDGSELITASIMWPPQTDYDVYALIRYADGRTETVAAFGTEKDAAFTLVSSDGAVRHLGDVGRTKAPAPKLFGRRNKELQPPPPLAVERIEIRPHAGIAAIVPVAYSAQSNGTGSFRRYQVSMSIDNGRGTTVTVAAANADDNDEIFTCVPGIILVRPDGIVIDSLESYSAPGSERRPVIDERLTVVMDAGETNAYK